MAGAAAAPCAPAGPKVVTRKITTEYDGAEMSEFQDTPEAGYLAVSPGDTVEILNDEAPGHSRNRYRSYVFGRKRKSNGGYKEGWLPVQVYD